MNDRRARVKCMKMLRNLLLINSLALVLLQAEAWQVNTVKGSIGGKFSSLRIDKLGNAHVSYCYDQQGLLEYSFWDRKLNQWFTTNVGRCSGFTSLALDSKQRPHISSPGGDGTIMHTYWDGTAWQKQVVDVRGIVVNYYTSIVLDANDYPSISYYEEQGRGDNRLRLRVVRWNGKVWELRTVDSDLGSGKFNSLAIDSEGRLRVAYGNVEYQNVSLRYAEWDGHAWRVEVVDSAEPKRSMWSVSMVLDGKSVPHIVYTDVQLRVIKYATKVDGKWRLETVDSVAGVAYPDRNGIALDCMGIPYLSYFDSGSGVLKVAHKQGNKWLVEVVDENFAGFTSSLRLSQDGVFVTYANETGQQLKFARKSLEQCSSGESAHVEVSAK